LQKIFFFKSRRHLRILDLRRVKWSKFHNEDSQILGATMATWRPEIVHPWLLFLLLLLLLFVVICTLSIYNYVFETNHVSREYSVAGILYLQVIIHVTLFPMLNVLCFYISTFRSSALCPIWLLHIICWFRAFPVCRSGILWIIIIIIIIIIISCMQGIYTYIPETNHVSTKYSVAAIL
jgi:hypothetical protein